jgi:hypothetical protein
LPRSDSAVSLPDLSLDVGKRHLQTAAILEQSLDPWFAATRTLRTSRRWNELRKHAIDLG